MTGLGIALLVLAALTLLWVVHRMLRERTVLPPRLLAVLAASGAVLSLVCWWLENVLFRLTGLGLTGERGHAAGALVAMLVFAVPLEEASKLIAVWPLYQAGRFRERADGVLAAVATAAGFAMGEGALYLLLDTTLVLLPLRVLLGAVAHLFFAGAWGYVLGDPTRGHWLRWIWVISVVFHGLFDHIVYSRGVGTLILSGPLLLAMTGGGWLGLREARVPPELQLIETPTFAQGPSLRVLVRAVREREQPLMLHWIAIGALVTTGVVIAALALAIYVGHQIGVDFAAADEGDVRANAPLLLLGGALLLAFPFAGYLVARASRSRSVLEPAMGALLAIVVVVVLLSLAAPVAIIFVLAVAPVAFVLSCFGAWFGIDR